LTPPLRLLRFEGRTFLITRLKSPKRFALIAYRAVIPQVGTKLMVHRVCGVSGDFIEIKAGTLYVNGMNVDSELRLTHVYKVRQEQVASLPFKEEDAYSIPPYYDTLYIRLEDRVVKKEQLECSRYILPAGLRDEAIYRVYQKSWNPDNFGPLRVPAGKFFVLGDNRGKAQDSRHLGLVDRAKVLGVVII
jgi:signal peptidase I